MPIQKIILSAVILFSSLTFAVDKAASYEAAPNKAASYEAALIIPWNFIAEKINRDYSSVDIPVQLSHLEAQGVPIQIPEVRLKLSFGLAPIESEESMTVWETKQLKIDVSVPNFEVQKDIEQNLGGSLVIVHLQAQCQGFQLQQNSATVSVDALWKNNDEDHLAVDIENTNIAWPDNSWKISEIQCEGPIGFADLVEQELNKQLADPSLMAPLFQEQLQKVVSEKINTTLVNLQKGVWKSLLEQNFSFAILGNKIANSKGLQLQVGFKVGHPNAETGEMTPIDVRAEDLQKVGNKPTLIFSRSALEKLLQQQTVWPKMNYSLNSFSGFKSLLKSRFLQFFVWPDLWNFSKSTTFQAVTELNGGLTLNVDQSLASSGEMRATLRTTVKAPRKGSVWDYLFLTTSMRSRMKSQVANGIFSVSFSSASLSTSLKFGDAYVKRFSPSKRIALSTIKKAVEKNVSAKAFTFALPDLEISPEMKFQASSLKRIQPELFMLEWTQLK